MHKSRKSNASRLVLGIWVSCHSDQPVFVL
ncbi:hypothetical protein A2U01_0106040, partial [Trifolium medium]|nr:hypothetical protein [Trifolium medium]